MLLTGHGTGQTPQEAEANARADLHDKILTLHMANLAGQFMAGGMACFMTLVVQFCMRPIPTLLAGSVFAGVGTLVYTLFHASLPEHPIGMAFAFLFAAICLVPLLLPLASFFTLCAATLEVWERRLMNKAPSAIRMITATASALAPTWIALALLIEDAQDGTPIELGFMAFLTLSFLGFMQFVVLVSRQRTGRLVGDYNWCGKRWPESQFPVEHSDENTAKPDMQPPTP